ncbi:AAA domain-containing protein [Cyathus striatus]|nr:AAA domain-containing protein [Cyathus striatus]
MTTPGGSKAEDSPISGVGDDFQHHEKIVLILCGLIASGKSTFAENLQTHFPQFRRCSQDDLGDRRRVETLARESLDLGLSVCIDRTNFNASQRSHWIEIAREFPGTLVWVIVFDTPYETCAARLQGRTSHPTIKTFDQGLSVLSRFSADFRRPHPREGYDRILYIKPSEHPSPVYTRTDISAILHRVRDSSPVHWNNASGAHTSQLSSEYYSNRGRPFRGRRGTYDEYNFVPRARGGFIPRRSYNGFHGGHSAPYRGSSTAFRSLGRSAGDTESGWRNHSKIHEQPEQNPNTLENYIQESGGVD